MSAKPLALKHLKDLIEDIYVQKEKYDEKCAGNRLPKETMEQYMYNYLNQRYGLKSLIIEWASAIICGIKRYSVEDSDVALFGKILRNECDEEYRFVHNEVKAAINELLCERIKQRYRNKTETAIANMASTIQAGNIEEWQWKEIVAKMYNEEHYSILEQHIQDRIAELNVPSVRTAHRRMTREELMQLQRQRDRSIPFHEFQKIVLDFQLATHEKYIRKFVDLFKKVDGDTNGVINEEEFRRMIARMKVTTGEEHVEKLLQVVDPYNNQQITFTECLALLSSVTSPTTPRKTS